MTSEPGGDGPGPGGPHDRVRVEATVRGRVQGVGYRVFALREATYLGLDGFVANEADGSVRVVAEGPRFALTSLLARLEDGPPAGFVDRVLVRWEPARGIGSGFRIESGAHRGD
ncbi:MAG TPA: acylphosphatase [Candidatus Limnocylindrales bacterium]|nr:acylphosphatase [Candidatus Limnocylindrales bacterium]